MHGCYVYTYVYMHACVYRCMYGCEYGHLGYLYMCVVYMDVHEQTQVCMYVCMHMCEYAHCMCCISMDIHACICIGALFMQV